MICLRRNFFSRCFVNWSEDSDVGYVCALLNMREYVFSIRETIAKCRIVERLLFSLIMKLADKRVKESKSRSKTLMSPWRVESSYTKLTRVKNV